MLGVLHITCALLGLCIGAFVFLRPKGSRRHRIAGYTYVACLLFVNITALSIYDQSVDGGPFHVLAVFSLSTLVAALATVVLRAPNPGWLNLHAHFMGWSYVGVISAGVGQLLGMLNIQPALLSVGVPSALAVIFGGVIVHLKVPAAISALKLPGKTTLTRPSI